MKPTTIHLDLRTPQVMAILNVTPDSFYAESRVAEAEAIAQRIAEALAEGAAIIDVGGYSSRPGAAEVSVEEELRRVMLGVEQVRRLAPEVVVSVDTFRSEVVARIVEAHGAVVVNDISAGELDPAMLDVVARHNLPYIAMHMKGDPQTMQHYAEYEDVVGEVIAYFTYKVSQFEAAGIRREQLILDPGFGFAKTTEQNYALLAGLHRLVALGYPVLAGLSRKSMIWRTLGVSSDDALAGTVALGWEALRQGATILRVHDVREAVDTVTIFEKFRQNML